MIVEHNRSGFDTNVHWSTRYQFQRRPAQSCVCVFLSLFPSQSAVERHMLHAPLPFRWIDPSRATKLIQEQAAAEGERRGVERGIVGFFGIAWLRRYSSTGITYRHLTLIEYGWCWKKNCLIYWLRADSRIFGLHSEHVICNLPQGSLCVCTTIIGFYNRFMYNGMIGHVMIVCLMLYSQCRQLTVFLTL